ncbi:microcin C transport system substrate-binding protein [Stella humosa]|uniref:Microcin C transport system substrate-binding protein n=1 Tax=Stella humosa TaxID=94 RepID=A0A3N1LI91_9PROT|nr:extracellular solute-binding protein [Stella humosa]ROP91062.1 microcin C transport system substrate-binding protein [Stella humosa]BBK34588.1 ABC transporter substrate-binding protein [Stella humosa]
MTMFARILAAPLVVAAPLLVAAIAAGPAQADEKPRHGMSMYGELKYPPDFKHFEYANPAAPKGGTVRLAAIGTYDTLNPFTLKGVPAAGAGLLFQTLTANSGDEAFSEYGIVAESFIVPEDRSWVAFNLRPEAKFNDGTPITPDDLIFTLETLKTKGAPFYRTYYADVAKGEVTGPRQVRFTFRAADNPELPLIVGQMPILPRAYWANREFDRTTLEAPLGSGPYVVESVDAGRSITYKRIENHWSDQVPALKGQYNFARIRYDYYRDSTVALEAFKGGEYDFRQENVAKDWATGYDAPAVTEGLIKREEIANEQPTGMQGFVFNIRRPIFADRRVRDAIAHAFDFEWTNKTLFYGAYARTRSYFSNSELASSGLPGPAELAILEPFRGQVPDEVFTKEYVPPSTDGSGNLRDNLRVAFDQLKAAGWVIKDRRLVHEKTGEAMSFEILLSQPTWERIALPFAKNLERLGIQARVRTVDSAQYQKRMETFDYDVTVEVFGQSLSPGNEQRDMWSSAAAKVEGSRNTIGVADPVVDKLIELVINAPDRQALVDRTRALDRVLLWGHYAIPNWHSRTWRIAYWDRFARPPVTAKYSLGFLATWWIDPAKESALRARRPNRSN